MSLDDQIRSLLAAANDPRNKTPATLALVKERVLLAASSGQGFAWTVSPAQACVERLGPATTVLVAIAIGEGRAAVGAVSGPSPAVGLMACGGAWDDELCDKHGPSDLSRLDRLMAWCRVDADDRVSAPTEDFLAWAR
jgi:hypothetical protein